VVAAAALSPPVHARTGKPRRRVHEGWLAGLAAEVVGVAPLVSSIRWAAVRGFLLVAV
jgi:hypothetical protein